MFKLSFPINNNIYIKNPEHSELGQRIVKHSIDSISKLGFEHFTFKKLAQDINTTEATIYRYFENKHRLLLYIINWYWFYIDYIIDIRVQNITAPEVKLETVLSILTKELDFSNGSLDYNTLHLNHIVLHESSKVYFIKEVNEINQHQVFKPYKELCSKIADIITAYCPKYPYPLSLSSTIMETSHYQQFFSEHLPKLTDVKDDKKNYVFTFLKDLVFRALTK